MNKMAGGFAEMMDANMKSDHRSQPETGGTAHHFHVHGTDSHAVVESHGSEHQVLAMKEFGKGEHEALGKHLMGHLGLDDKEPSTEADKSGDAYESEGKGGDGIAAL